MEKKKEKKDTAINTRYPQEVLEAMRRLSQEHERSFNGEVIWALRQYIAQVKSGKRND